MKVETLGIDGRSAEKYRDLFGSIAAEALRKSELTEPIYAVTVDFSSNRSERKVTAGALTTRQRDADEALGLEALVKEPNINAGLLRVRSDLAEKLRVAANRIKVLSIVYDSWGLSAIDPFPRMSLNFSGPPGTGKTLAAHFLAKQIGKHIIEVSYADVVSKYFGQAAKNLSRLFEFAYANDAILFVDEAETLLSRRSNGSGEAADHAVNSMRSQLLMLMERTPIISIFASNLIESYDAAFLSRIITLEFELPDLDIRRSIWDAHLPNTKSLRV